MTSRLKFPAKRMKRLIAAGLTGGLLAALAAPTRLDAQALGDAASLKRLSAGEVLVIVEPVSGSTAGRAHAAIEIALPPAALWAILLDCNRTLKFVRRLKSCRVTSADPGGRWDVREHVVE